MKKKLFMGCLIGFLSCGTPLWAAQADLMDKSLEELLNMTVTSVAGREQKKNEVASSMTVITKEDIQRSGAHNIPDLFYRVPGMQVRKLSAKEYYVGIRSAAYLATSNLLVLIDGVVLFSPTLSATFWDTIPISLNEIERIEIIRGPGGVLYSSNAVNGVINIITKKATEKDNYIAQRAGTMNFLETQLGVGQKVNDKLSVRMFGRYGQTTGFRDEVLGGKFSNRLTDHTIGGKVQYDWSEDTHLVIDGKSIDETATDTLFRTKRMPYDRAILAQFQQKVNETYDYSLHIDDNAARTIDDMRISSVSGKTQHNVKYTLGGDHVASLGAEWRYNRLNAPLPFAPPLRDSKNSQRIMSLFAQDEYRPADKWILTAGARASENTLVSPKRGALIEPRGSVVYLLNDKQSVRTVISRTYRTPCFLEKETDYYGFLFGDPTIEPERNVTYEVGWQGVLFNDKLHMDTSVFYAELKDAILQDFTTAYPLVMYDNNGSLQTMGFEWKGSYQLTDALSLKSDYTYMNVDVKADHDFDYASSQSRLISRHQLGMGVDYVKNRLVVDIYGKWVSKYTVPAETVFYHYKKYPSYYKTMVRVAYAFKMPGMKMKSDDAEMELVANDFLGGNTFEGRGLFEQVLFREPDIYLGLKIKF